MHNILTIIFLFLSITNFCSGQIESNISLGIDEFLLKKTNDLYEKNICLVTNSGAINKDGLTSVEILNEEFDIQIVFNLDKKELKDKSQGYEEFYIFDFSIDDLINKIRNLDELYKANKIFKKTIDYDFFYKNKFKKYLWKFPYIFSLGINFTRKSKIYRTCIRCFSRKRK